MNIHRCALLLGIALSVSLVSLPLLGQEISGSLSETSLPSVPYVLEPVLPEPSIRLQTHLIPLGIEGGQDYILLPLRVIGSFSFSERVIGEASMPVLLEFPSEDDTGFEIGNPRIGLEAPILVAGGRTHRWTFALDLFLPLTQIGEPENEQDEAGVLEREARYGLISSALPTLSPDFAAERLPVVIGTHYRLRLRKFIGELGLDFPFLIGFDLDGEQMFSDGEILMRYGMMLGYDVHPIYPSLEFVGVTQLNGEGDSWTALLGTAGVRYAVRGFEPGVAVTFPVMLGDDSLESSVYVSLEFVYRFR